MKRLLLLITLCLVAFSLTAQTVIYEDTAELYWVAPDGLAMLPGDTLSYEVYVYDNLNPVIDNQDIASLIYIGETESEEMSITFPERREWAVGVRAILTDGGGTSGIPSRVAWSVNLEDVDVAAMGGPFTFVPLTHLVQPISPGNLKDQRY